MEGNGAFKNVDELKEWYSSTLEGLARGARTIGREDNHEGFVVTNAQYIAVSVSTLNIVYKHIHYKMIGKDPRDVLESEEVLNRYFQ